MENMAAISDDDSSTSATSIVNKKIYLIIRRKKVTLYLDTQEGIRVLELKKMIEAILKIQAEDQQLFAFSNNYVLDECKELEEIKEWKELSDSTALLSDYGLSSETAPVTNPATLGLAVRQEDGSFESLEVTSYSTAEWSKFSDFLAAKKGEKAAAHEKFDNNFDEID